MAERDNLIQRALGNIREVAQRRLSDVSSGVQTFQVRNQAASQQRGNFNQAISQRVNNVVGNVKAIANPQTRADFMRPATSFVTDAYNRAGDRNRRINVQQVQPALNRVKTSFQQDPNRYNLFAQLSKGNTALIPTAQNKGKTNVPVLDDLGTAAGGFIQNRIIQPALDIPKNTRIALDPKKSLLERGIGGLSAVAGLVPGIDDLGFAGYDYLKGVQANSRKTGGGNSYANVQAGLKAFGGQEQVGLGDAITDNPTAQTALNIAELPLMIVGGLKGAKRAQRLEQIRKMEIDINRAILFAQNIDKVPDINKRAQQYAHIYETAQKAIPEIVNSKEMKKLSNSSQSEWLRTVSSFMGDAIYTAKNPEVNIGFNTRALKGNQPPQPTKGVETNTFYHGSTNNKLTSLEPGAKTGLNEKKNLIYLTDSPDTAKNYTKVRGADGTGKGVLTDSKTGRVYNVNVDGKVLNAYDFETLGSLKNAPGFESLSSKTKNQITNPTGLSAGILETNKELRDFLSKNGYSAVKAQLPDGLPGASEIIVIDPSKAKLTNSPTKGAEPIKQLTVKGGKIVEETRKPILRTQLTGRQLGMTNEQLKFVEATGKQPKVKVKQPGKLQTDEDLSFSEAQVAEAGLNTPARAWNMARALPDKLKTEFESFVNARRSLDLDSQVVRKEFSELDSKGIEGLFEVQSGKKTPENARVRKYFDDKFQEVKKAGVDLGYRENYLPQLWQNTDDEITQVFGKKLGKTPSFSLERVIEDYKKGIAAGLTPKFTKVSDLVGSYEKTANRIIANRKFFDHLVDNNYIAPQTKAPKGWVSLNPDAFPTFKTKFEGSEYQGNYAAPREVADVINNYFKSQEGALATAANFTSTVKNRILVGGIPLTGINAHGANILARSTLAFNNPITGGLKVGQWVANPGSAEKYLGEHLKDAQKFVRAGLTITTEDYNARKPLVEAASKISKGFEKLDSTYDKWFGDPLFQKVIPATKLKYAKEVYSDLLKRGVPEAEALSQASRTANDMFGGINTEQIARSREFQNIMRVIFLAPDWAETNLRLANNTLKGTTGIGVKAGKIPFDFKTSRFKDPKYAAYRTVARNLLATYIAYNVVNKATSGNFMWENEPGQEFAIDTGQYDSNGKKIYFRPYGTAADFLRLPYEVASGFARGDSTVALKTVTNRLNPATATAIRLATNQDYLGRPLAGKDNYGNEIPLAQGLINQGTELASGVVGIPNFARAPIDYATGKASAAEAVSSALELPLRFKGGAYSKEDKELLASLKAEGADRNTIGTTLKAKKDGVKKPTFEATKDMPKTTMDKVALAAQGLTKDPGNTIKAIFTQEKLRKIEGNAVILKRQDFLNKSKDKNLQRDHIIPLGLGGDNSEKNLVYVEKAYHAEKTKLDQKLIRQLQKGEITRQEAQKQVKAWVNANPTKHYVVEEPKTTKETSNTLEDIAKLPTSNKYEQAAKDSKLFSKFSSLETSGKLTSEEKSLIAKELRVTPEDLDYYSTAKRTNNEKTPVVVEAITGKSEDEYMRYLIENRKKVNGKNLVSDGVLDNLVEDGLIKEWQAKWIKSKFTGETEIDPKTGKVTLKAKKKSGKGTKALKPKYKQFRAKSVGKVKTTLPQKLRVKKVKLRSIQL